MYIYIYMYMYIYIYIYIYIYMRIFGNLGDFFLKTYLYFWPSSFGERPSPSPMVNVSRRRLVASWAAAGDAAPLAAGDGLRRLRLPPSPSTPQSSKHGWCPPSLFIASDRTSDVAFRSPAAAVTMRSGDVVDGWTSDRWRARRQLQLQQPPPPPLRPSPGPPLLSTGGTRQSRLTSAAAAGTRRKRPATHNALSYAQVKRL